MNAKVTGTKTYSFNVSRENLGNKDALSKEGTSALHEAARSARPDIVKYLIEHGANPNILDSDGKKPIDVIGVQRAARGGNAPGASQAPAGGQARGAAPAAGRGGSNPQAVAEIRAMLEGAATQK